jgi:hypothetical protein
MSKAVWYLLFISLVWLNGCGVMKKAAQQEIHEFAGMEGLAENCVEGDTIQSILIKKAEAILSFDNERYEASLTLYSKRDSIIYLSAVSSGFEILRASVKRDSIKVINRLEKIVYSAPLKRKFGYQYPVNFHDLQNLISIRYLCKDIDRARDDRINSIVFDLDETNIKKRITLNRIDLDMTIFEFYHLLTNRYLMGERRDNSFRIYSNFMITEFEILASGGERTYNRDIVVKMDVNPRKYSFTELR